MSQLIIYSTLSKLPYCIAVSFSISSNVSNCHIGMFSGHYQYHQTQLDLYGSLDPGEWSINPCCLSPYNNEPGFGKIHEILVLYISYIYTYIYVYIYIYIYTGPEFAHLCGCRCPGTWQCQVISMHSPDYKIRGFLLVLVAIRLFSLMMTFDNSILRIFLHFQCCGRHTCGTGH